MIYEQQNQRCPQPVPIDYKIFCSNWQNQRNQTLNIVFFSEDLNPIEAWHADRIHHREEDFQLEKGTNVPWDCVMCNNVPWDCVKYKVHQCTHGICEHKKSWFVWLIGLKKSIHCDYLNARAVPHPQDRIWCGNSSPERVYGIEPMPRPKDMPKDISRITGR